jgi:ribose transport system permease protein
MSTAAPERRLAERVRGVRMSRGLTTILIALVILVVASAVFARSSISGGALQGMLPFAAILAIAGLGQTLVVQQGGIDLSVPGAISLTVVICTHQANGVNSKLLSAALTALAVTIVAGLLNGFLAGRLGINPIVATLGTNAVLYAGVFQVSGGVPRSTTTLLANIAGGTSFSVPNAVFFAVGATIVTTVVVKSTVVGRRFEATGANPSAAWATGLKVQRHQASGYVWAMILYWLAGVLLAGVVAQPTAYQGDNYLLPSVAVVVLGGTSLLGGRGNLVASAIAALFLSQLEQFVLALGVTYAVQTLVQAAALAIGVALYTINWQAVRRRLAGGRGASSVITPSPSSATTSP